MPTFKTHH